MGRNGPTSLPLGLMTPIVPATTSTRKLRVSANATPAPAISEAPRMSMRRRPIRSACVLSQSETAVSPMSVSVSNRPICCVPIPSWVRYRTKTTDNAPYANNRVKRVSSRIGAVPRVPNDEHIVADHGNPVEADVEIDPLIFVRVLDEAEQTRAGIEVVFEVTRGLEGGEDARWEARRGARHVDADDGMATAPPRALEFHVGAAAPVER